MFRAFAVTVIFTVCALSSNHSAAQEGTSDPAWDKAGPTLEDLPLRMPVRKPGPAPYWSRQSHARRLAPGVAWRGDGADEAHARVMTRFFDRHFGIRERSRNRLRSCQR